MSLVPVNWRRWNWWGIAASVMFVAPVVLVLWVVPELANTSDGMKDALTVSLLIAGSLAGVGLLLRALAHTNTKRYSWVDGVGKIFGVTAWSSGLVAVVIFAGIDSGLDPLVTVSTFVVPVVAIGGIFMIASIWFMADRNDPPAPVARPDVSD